MRGAGERGMWPAGGRVCGLRAKGTEDEPCSTAGGATPGTLRPRRPAFPSPTPGVVVSGSGGIRDRRRPWLPVPMRVRRAGVATIRRRGRLKVALRDAMPGRGFGGLASRGCGPPKARSVPGGSGDEGHPRRPQPERRSPPSRMPGMAASGPGGVCDRRSASAGELVAATTDSGCDAGWPSEGARGPEAAPGEPGTGDAVPDARRVPGGGRPDRPRPPQGPDSRSHPAAGHDGTGAEGHPYEGEARPEGAGGVRSPGCGFRRWPGCTAADRHDVSRPSPARHAAPRRDHSGGTIPHERRQPDEHLLVPSREARASARDGSEARGGVGACVRAEGIASRYSLFHQRRRWSARRISPQPGFPA